MPITTLFIDVGGVLLTNGWDHKERQSAVQHFNLDGADYERLHIANINLLETDKITLDDYLNRTIFWQDRPFTPKQFKEFMFSQSLPHEDMIAFVKEIKQQYGLKIAIVSNEQRVLTDYRESKFHFEEFVEYYIVSCYVYFQKPRPAHLQNCSRCFSHTYDRSCFYR